MNLAEDRILCLSIYCLEGKDYSLEYIPSAEADIRVIESFVEIM